MKTYPLHPLAELFPPMTDAELADLSADIRANGLRGAITLFEDQILDGRNRARACELAEVEPTYRQHKTGDPLAFVISANLHRRHLTTSQRATIAAKIATAGDGNPKPFVKSGLPKTAKNGDFLIGNLVQKDTVGGGLTNEQAAKAMNVSEHSVRRAKELEKHAPEAVADVAAGKVTLGAALKAASKPPGKPASASVQLDDTGYPIPANIAEDWHRATITARELMGYASKIKSSLQKMFEDDDIIIQEVSNTEVTRLQSIYYTLKTILPYGVCPVCQGRGRKTCTFCRHRGWVSKYLYSRCGSDKVKEMRLAAKSAIEKAAK